MPELHGVAIGDLHLDKMRKHFPEKHLTLQYQAVSRALHHAYRQGATIAIFLGDIGEGGKDFTNNLVLSAEAQDMLVSLVHDWAPKLKLIFYAGNHDFTDLKSQTLSTFARLSKLAYLPAEFHLTSTVLKHKGLRLNILPYPAEEPPDSNLTFAHYEVAGAVMDSGRACDSAHKHRHGGTPFIQGHLHTPQIIRNHHYPGTLYQTAFGERLPKGFAEFKWDGTRFKYRWVEQDPPFTLHNLRVHSRKDLKEIVEDPLHLYKLFVSETVRLTDTDLARPNIVNRLNFGSDKEADALEAAEFALEEQTLDLGYDAILDTLLANEGLSPKLVRLCKVELDNFTKQNATGKRP